MKRAALILALAVAVPAWAQAPSEADKAAPKEEAAQSAEKQAKSEVPARKSAAHKHSRRMEDARHCLDEPTNEAIIKCAEAYL
ncbi:MAG TPA: hypothetical protein VFV74_05135 [Burkholderiales bacterium]|nr:hypothetical protein [Burkholderiales bacterium]